MRPKKSLRLKVSEALGRRPIEGHTLSVAYTYTDGDDNRLSIREWTDSSRTTGILWWKKTKKTGYWRTIWYISNKALSVRDPKMARAFARLLIPLGIKVVQS